MQVLAVEALAIALALLAMFGSAAIQSGSWPRGADAIGLGASLAVSGAVLITALHWPVLASLRRRGVRLEPVRAAVLAALGVNAPVYAVLAVVGRDRSLFAGGEAALLALGFALMGAVFGAGYASIQRRRLSAADLSQGPATRGNQ